MYICVHTYIYMYVHTHPLHMCISCLHKLICRQRASPIFEPHSLYLVDTPRLATKILFNPFVGARKYRSHDTKTAVP